MDDLGLGLRFEDIGRRGVGGFGTELELGNVVRLSTPREVPSGLPSSTHKVVDIITKIQTRISPQPARTYTSRLAIQKVMRDRWVGQ